MALQKNFCSFASQLAKQKAGVVIITQRCISFDKLDNKKITRLESDIEMKDNPQFNSILINRNPRNLQQLSFEMKPQGFWLEKNPSLYWNKVVIEKVGKHLNAFLLHWSGRKLVEVSTQELKLQKYFRNINADSAALIGKILANRCLQCGYLTAHSDKGQGNNSSILNNFIKSVEDNGIVLEELKPIHPRNINDL